MNKIILYIIFSVFTFSSCEKVTPDAIIPFAFVNQDINLNLIQYQNLRNIGGYIFIPSGDNSGYRGIIVYHEGNGIYRAFESACTYDPDCDHVVVDDSSLFMRHECCSSTFNFNGNPTGGPASLDLLQYDTFVDGIYLKIRNR